MANTAVIYLDALDATFRCFECMTKAPSVAGLSRSRRHRPQPVKPDRPIWCDDCGASVAAN